ncbi:50S ribosomal protein L1 [Candidatus Woesearchaeota archaeon]|nr:50S ribosomal protein L1 [Candidatus Woesearchaeota archaeon]
MEKHQIINCIREARNSSKKRKFDQNFDLIINLKGLDLKKPEHQIDLYISLPFSRGRKAKICAIVGPELLDNAKKTVDHTITSDSLANLKKNEIKVLARDYDYFIAQANIMPKIATAFGRIFGPRGKMPNPKAGCVVPPNANLSPLVERLQKMIRVSAKVSPVVMCAVGSESLKDDDLAENLLIVYNSVLKALPNESENIKNAFIKLTMGKPVKIRDKEEAAKEAPKGKK